MTSTATRTMAISASRSTLPTSHPRVPAARSQIECRGRRGGPGGSGSGGRSWSGRGPPATSVHELLECPVCTNSMFPPIHQAVGQQSKTSHPAGHYHRGGRSVLARHHIAKRLCGQRAEAL